MTQLLNYLPNLLEAEAEFSDIHIETGKEMKWRLPTGWENTGYGIVEETDMFSFLAQMTTEWKSELNKVQALNRTIDVGVVRIRCSAYRTRANAGIGLDLRILPMEVRPLSSLGLPVQVGQFANAPKGLLLVAGATGAGKSTTIAAVAEEINQQRSVHVVTLEEPIESLYNEKKAIITQREVGPSADIRTFPQGVYEAMRQSPDVIIVGEIRDMATADAAFHAAESGHYVMGSIHSKSGLGTISKILSFFPDDMRSSKAAMLANSLCGVVYQTRLPTADNKHSVVATEILSSVNHELSDAMTNPAKMRALEERLRTGQWRGNSHLNDALRTMIKNDVITKRAATAATYEPEGLA